MLSTRITVDELSRAAEVRSAMIIELQQLPVWLETRLAMIPANLRPVTARYLNALAETMWELSSSVHDLALTELSSRAGLDPSTSGTAFVLWTSIPVSDLWTDPPTCRCGGYGIGGFYIGSHYIGPTCSTSSSGRWQRNFER